jgi:hypothetical protein
VKPKINGGIAFCSRNCPLLKTGICDKTGKQTVVGTVCYPWVVDLVQYAEALSSSLDGMANRRLGQIIPAQELVNAYNQWKGGLR